MAITPLDADFVEFLRNILRDGPKLTLWQYQAAFPGLTVTGSSERHMATEKMQRLLDEGHPNALSTEVLACVLACGSAPALAKVPESC